MTYDTVAWDIAARFGNVARGDGLANVMFVHRQLLLNSIFYNAEVLIRITYTYNQYKPCRTICKANIEKICIIALSATLTSAVHRGILR